MSLVVKYLADAPELTPLLASWLYEEWGRRDPGDSLERFEKQLSDRMNRDRFPLALIAFQGSQPVGTASLIIREMETHPQFLHWLGGVYVHPPYRNRGLGAQIVECAASEAERLGVRDLYLYTRQHESFYARLGWSPVERSPYCGRQVVIMRRVLAARQSKG